MISNFTLVGADDGSPNHGLRLRHGTKGKLWNGLITGFAQAIRVGSECDAYVIDGSLAVKNTDLFSNVTNFNNAGAIGTDPSISLSGPTLNGYIGTDASNAVDPSTVNAWFNSVNFRGAVEASNDWTAGWTVGL